MNGSHGKLLKNFGHSIVEVEKNHLFEYSEIILSKKMLPNIIKNYFKPNKTHKNLIEAIGSTFFVKRLFGITVIEYRSEAGRIRSVLNYFGLLCFLFWYTLFFFCVYVAYSEDQSVLRMLFDTKLKQYGDNYERVATILIVVYAMWKLPFSMNSNADYVQFSADLDEVIRNIGVTVNYHKHAYIALVTSLMQIVVFIARVMSIWVTVRNLNVPVPHERILQEVYSDVLSLILSGHYCYYLSVLKARYGIMNEVLSDIKWQQKKRIAFEYTMFVGDGKNDFLHKDKYICQKIKKCARVYSMLFQATGRVSKIFGVGLVIIMTFGMNNIILYMFYFMEATASPLFHDLERYAYFLAYVFWQILYASGIIYIIIYFSETTLSEAKNAAYITHEIINCDFSPSVTAEAMQLSLQLLHETPTFTACGLFHLDYLLLQQGTRTVVTFLVILLQFVMDA